MVIMHPHPMHHIGCMTVLNLTWFRASPLPCLRRSGFAQAGIKGEEELDRVNVYFWDKSSSEKDLLPVINDDKE